MRAGDWMGGVVVVGGDVAAGEPWCADGVGSVVDCVVVGAVVWPVELCVMADEPGVTV